MLKAQYYSKGSEKPTSVNLPSEFGSDVNLNLISQAVHVYRARSHKGTAMSKTRAEVSITKKKIYRQKGTGGARHGAKSAPIFVGGGVTHGPRGVKRVLRLPKSQKRAALKSALAHKAQLGQIVISEELLSIAKTKQGQQIIDKIKVSQKDAKNFTFVLREPNELVQRSLRNLANCKVATLSKLNAMAVIAGGTLVFDNTFAPKVKQTKSK